MAVKRTEAEVAAVVMQYMLNDGWDCYPEVEVPYGGRADIVGVRPFPFMPHRLCIHVVECKTAWTLSLLEQAMERRAIAHYVSIAAPSRPGRFYWRLCREHGIGMIRFGRSFDLGVDEHRGEPPRLYRHHRRERQLGLGPKLLLERLDEDMKRYAPGTTAGAGYSTPWRRTMDRAAAYVAEHPGCTVSELLENVEHHYSSGASARQGILLWLGQRDDIEARREGRLMRFYPPGVESNQPALTSEN